MNGGIVGYSMDNINGFVHGPQLDKESRRNTIISAIDKLYNDIMCQYQSGQMVIYNPNLFARLSKETFLRWVIQNNKNILDLFN